MSENVSSIQITQNSAPLAAETYDHDPNRILPVLGGLGVAFVLSMGGAMVSASSQNAVKVPASHHRTVRDPHTALPKPDTTQLLTIPRSYFNQ